MSPSQALQELLSAIADSVKAGGELGVPAGHLYAIVMGVLSLAQFEQVMAALVAMKMVRKSGHVYHYVGEKDGA